MKDQVKVAQSASQGFLGVVCSIFVSEPALLRDLGCKSSIMLSYEHFKSGNETPMKPKLIYHAFSKAVNGT